MNERVIDRIRHAHAYGLDWIGGEGQPGIVAARAAVPDTLVFHGLEWNIPAAEHGTVFVHRDPGVA